MAKALVILADGFEEIEAVAVIDILRRADIQVVIAGIGNLQIIGSHGIKITTDAFLNDVMHHAYDAVILPGGEPGTTALQHDYAVEEVLKRQSHAGRLIGAICAAPRILDALGILDLKHATSYPATRPQMKNCEYEEDAVVVDGNIVTSRGAGTAMAFAYKLVEILNSSTAADDLRKGMVFS